MLIKVRKFKRSESKKKRLLLLMRNSLKEILHNFILKERLIFSSIR